MDEYGARAREVLAEEGRAATQPKEPRIDLKEAEKLYSELHDKHPDFRRIDLVTYLIGFAAKEDSREDEAMARFQEVIEKFPEVAAVRRRVDDGRRALLRRRRLAEGERRVQAHPRRRRDRATSRCSRSRGATGSSATPTQAAKDFKRVLDKAAEAERTGTAAQRRRSASLRDEALEYLVVVFTEDRSISAQGGLRLPRLDRRRAATRATS